MSYKEFGSLRFLNFFPKTEYYSEDRIGGLECGIGLACTEGYGPTYFASPLGSNMQTAEICLDFYNRCPESEAQTLLKQLGLELRKGMNYEKIKELLGTPVEDIPTYLGYVVGQRWKYYLGCYIDAQEGLIQVLITRKDLADDHARREDER